MDPQAGSSQSVISFADKSPASTFKPTHSRNNSTGSSKHSKQSRNWEIMDDGYSAPGSSMDLSIPGICEGYLMKRRKYPLKGWHKRYFLLEKGILKYAKTQQDILKGKLHGSLDVSMAVMSVNKKAKRIDLDGGDNLYHLKAKSSDLFYIWLTKLAAHRVFRKHEAMSVHRGVLHALSMNQSSLPIMANMTHQHQSTVSINHFLCQAELTELVQLIQRLHWLEGGIPLTNTDLEMRISMQNLFLEKPKKKSGKVGHSRTLSRVEAMGGMFTSSHLSTNNGSNMAASVQSIPDYVYTQLSNPQVTSPEAKKLHQDICVLSQRVHASLTSIHEVLTMERERLRQAWASPDLRQNASQQLATLCTTLSELDVQSHLTKVHSVSLSSGSTDESFCTVCTDQRSPSISRHSHRAPSVADSMAEYFDANEVIVCETSSEAEASDESGLSDITTTSTSEPDEATATLNYRESLNSATDKPNLVRTDTGRRTKLPAPGGDNSHIELEYTELLDIANNTDDPYLRMVRRFFFFFYVAAFSISEFRESFYNYRIIKRFSINYSHICKLHILKSVLILARYHQSVGTVFLGEWRPILIFIFCPDVQPDDHFQFYGFSRYARELNELTADLKDVLPPTDTRFRPDQRLLEEGKLAEADKRKDEVEEKQRERRKEMAKRGEEHIPRFFRKALDEAGREVWLYNGTYWKIRQDPGFSKTENLDLW
uniref:Oxysterol-binding protein-related protein 6-like n=1 Tax=Cyprinodon variegatus TaxID=28743 RepID=A0A3Q2DZK8_CYPVA